MYLGYVKAGRLDETDQLYKSKLETLKVQKVFSDSKYERTALKELLGYVRQGDSIVVESILDLSISAGEFIELAIKLFRQGVFVVCGLAIGVPREHPDLKPKLPKDLTIHQSHYTDRDMTAELVAYDKEVTQYNATRSGSKSENDWCDHILDYYREAMKYRMLDAAKSQGFDIVK